MKKPKAGDRVKLRDGRTIEVRRLTPWIEGRTMIQFAGQDPNQASQRAFLDDVVEINGVDPNAPTKKETDVKRWAASASHVSHRYATHFVLAGAYQGRGTGGQQIGRKGERTLSHAFIDGAQTSPCGISLDNASDVDEKAVPTCSRCAARVRAIAKAS